jgi:hypothetical protein
MNEILYYTTINRIIRHDMGMLVLYLVQISSLVIVLIIIFYNMIANGNLLECGVFKLFRRVKK